MNRQGKINAIHGLGASVIHIIVEDDKGERHVVPAEGRLTVLALEDAFGSVEAAIGEAIEYDTDDIGLLAQFLPL